MTDSRRDDDHIAFLQAVALRTHQIFHTAGIGTVQQFIKIMGMEIDRCAAVTHVQMCVNQGGVHFQFLIDIVGIQSHLLQNAAVLGDILGIIGRGYLPDPLLKVR